MFSFRGGALFHGGEESSWDCSCSVKSGAVACGFPFDFSPIFCSGFVKELCPSYLLLWYGVFPRKSKEVKVVLLRRRTVVILLHHVD